MEIEGEALVKSGPPVQVNGGQARVQPMGSFGDNWSGAEQLFWSDGGVGAVLDREIDVAALAKYAVELYLSRTPDYGQVQFEVDGKPSSVPFDGMAPQVLPSAPIHIGTYPLQAGKLRLYPAGPIH